MEKIPENPIEDLSAGLNRKSKKEKIVAAFQTRETKIPGHEEARGEIFRFERGQIYKAYQLLRTQIEKGAAEGKDVTEKKELLSTLREKVGGMKEQLDELNRQYHEAVEDIEVETEYGPFTVPVVELDLHKENEDTKDKRPPIFLVGSVATNYHQTAALSMALALDGHRVIVPTYPEQATVKRPDTFTQSLQKDGLKVHAALMKALIKEMNVGDVHLMGVSMGSAVAMEMATDKEFDLIDDLTVIEPLGIEQKGFLRLVKEFAFDQGILKSAPDAEARIKTFAQGAKTNKGTPGQLITDGKILAEKSFDIDRLKDIHPKGRYRVWSGTKSPVVDNEIVEKVFTDTEKVRQEEYPGASPVELYEVEGGDHGWPFMGALGFSRELDKERSSDAVTVIQEKDLEKSLVARTVKDLE